jgi:hypothetical protein
LRVLCPDLDREVPRAELEPTDLTFFDEVPTPDSLHIIIIDASTAMTSDLKDSVVAFAHDVDTKRGTLLASEIWFCDSERMPIGCPYINGFGEFPACEGIFEPSREVWHIAMRPGIENDGVCILMLFAGVSFSHDRNLEVVTYIDVLRLQCRRFSLSLVQVGNDLNTRASASSLCVERQQVVDYCIFG